VEHERVVRIRTMADANESLGLNHRNKDQVRECESVRNELKHHTSR
jgi:hypothetical protein